VGIPPFAIDLLSKSEYFPYGMKINELSYNGTHEQDREMNADGNYLDFGNFGYDTRTTRRWNLDPIDQIFISNYATFGSNPIYYSDPSGYEPTEAVNGVIPEDVMVYGDRDVELKPIPEAGKDLKEYLQKNRDNIVNKAKEFTPIKIDRPESTGVATSNTNNINKVDVLEFAKNNENTITNTLGGVSVGLHNTSANKWLGVTKSLTPSYYGTNFYSNQYMLNGQSSTIMWAGKIGRAGNAISSFFLFNRAIGLPNSDTPLSDGFSIGLDYGIIKTSTIIGGACGFLFGVGASAMKLMIEDELQSYHSFTPTRGNLNKTNYLPTDATTVNLPIK